MTHPTPKFLRRILSLSAAILLAALPAMAQLDPKLRVSDADFLDLFQRSNATAVKPEVLTVLDFSGSMNALMWHPKYWANKDQNNHYNDGQPSDNFWLRPYVAAHNNTTGPAINFTTFQLNEGIKTSYFPTNGVLIKADGTPVALADVGTQANANRNPANWVRKATHVRITMKHPTSGATRQLDLPIPWEIFNSPAGITIDMPSYSTRSAPDPQNSNAETFFDVPTYNLVDTSDQTGYINVSVRNAHGANAKGWIGHFWYNRDYTFWLFFGKDQANDPFNPTGTVATANYIIPDASTAAGRAFQNGIPCLTRYQGVKRAVIKTWLANQTKVFWAYRYLDTGEQNKSTVDPRNGSQSATKRNMRIFGKATGNTPDPSVKALQEALPTGGTPLTYALANAYAQMNVDKNCAFDAPHTDEKYVSPQCQTMFVLLFTDGQANDTYNNKSAIGGGVPYPSIPPAARCNAAVGNKAVKDAGTSTLNPGAANFNIWSLAGVAAHGADPLLAPDLITISTEYPTDSEKEPSQFAPFFIKKRGNGTAYKTDFTTPRPIQTITVGVSLPGSYAEVGSAKYALLAAAAAGDPLKLTWDLRQAKPYSATDKNTYFFDARDPEALVQNLASALDEVVAISNRQTTASPSIPFSGVGLANQVFVGQFKPPQSGGPIWTGDFMMFPTRTRDLQTIMLDAQGQPLTYLDCTTAMWSVARDIFNTASANYGGGGGGNVCGGTSGSGGTGGTTVACPPSPRAAPINWSQRRIFTRLAATAAVPEPQLIPFTDQDPGFTALKNSGQLPSSLTTDAARKDLINLVRGADLASTATPRANRPSIMGDIINSVPAVAEYNPSNTFANALPANIQTVLANPGAKLRVIFVGTNQGLLHAFAEASHINTAGVVEATVAELWAFLPTDFLPHLDYLTNANNTHRYAVDGSPFVYHLDAPAPGSVSGNGMVDRNATASERAVVVFGLRKGGRSYYALNIQDPTDPKLAWALRPDEAAVIPSGRVLGGDLADVAKMGFSSSTLIQGRVIYKTTQLRDVLFLGGGYSTPAVEANFGNQPLGRTVVAVDVENGQILQTWNLLTLSGLSAAAVGPVSTGVIPTRVFLNSDLHQRAYFTDAKGGVWALGSGKIRTTNPFLDFREDSSDLDAWRTNAGTLSLRRIYADATVNGVISTLPAPFLVGQFPVVSSSPNNPVAPTAVGIAFVTGNRMNPLDFGYASAAAAPSQHRFNVIFDRQDSKITGVDATPISTLKMTDFSGSTNAAADALDPSKPTYYLKTNHGYYVNFPGRTVTGTGNNESYFIPKGISDPTVLSYTAFYSYFTPTGSDPCSGGQGETRTFTICNVINPVVDSSSTPGARCQSGERQFWSGVASNFAALGTVAVMQAGMVVPASTPPSGDSTIMSVKTIMGNPTSRYPRVRTWRTVR